jgi:hypothetical protein
MTCGQSRGGATINQLKASGAHIVSAGTSRDLAGTCVGDTLKESARNAVEAGIGDLLETGVGDLLGDRVCHAVGAGVRAVVLACVMRRVSKSKNKQENNKQQVANLEAA